MNVLSDMEAAVGRMGGKELYVEIARTFAEALPESEAAVADALERCAWAEARRLVHSLKSNCAAMGAEEVRERAFLLEKACAASDKESANALFRLVREDLRALREALCALGDAQG